MKPEDVYSPSSVHSPLLDRLLGGGTAKASDAKSSRLVVLDARAGALGGSLAGALGGETPVLLLNPTTADMTALNTVIPAVPDDPMQAVLISTAPNGGSTPTYEVACLGYGLAAGDEESESETRKGGDERTRENRNTADHTFDATDHGLEDFLARVESRASKPFAAAVSVTSDPIPTGLKYFNTVLPLTNPFRYRTDSGGTQSGDGSMTVTLSVWGFLSQSATQNQQYLVIQAYYNLYPGKMKDNDSKGRGYVDAYLTSAIQPPLDALQHQPINGKNSWSGQVRFPVSYANPLGGYSIWYYDESVNQSIDKWSVKGNSSGASLGSYWYFHSPCDGSNISGSWKKAFNTWGHVESMSGGSTGSLGVNEISAWFTNTLYTGTIIVPCTYTMKGVRFWSSDCFLGVCYTEHCAWNTKYWYPSISVNMASINP